MPGIEVACYDLGFQTKQNRCSVSVRFRKGGSPDAELVKKTFEVEPSIAVFLADMLRNEKPIFMDPEDGIIGTRWEEVGEEES